MSHMRKRGFTLIELAMILALIGLLMTVFLPIANHQLLKSRVNSAMEQGRSIHASFFFMDCFPPTTRGAGFWWPKYGPTAVTNEQYQNSTDLFIHMVTGGIMTVTFAWFAPHGVEPARGGYTSFRAENNGWCVVGNVDEAGYPETAPFLFTRNLLNFSKLDVVITEQGGKVASDFLPADPYAPFGGRDAFVLIMKSGAGFGLYGEKLRYSNFTNLFQQVDTNGVRLTNPILRP